MSKSIGLTDGGGGDSALPSAGASAGVVPGTISLGRVVIRSVGISPSIGMAPGETWFRGNQWPPANTEPPSLSEPAPWHHNANRHFTPVTFPNGQGNSFEITLPPRAWDPAFYQIVLLTEFAKNWVPKATTTAALQTILTNAIAAAHTERRNLEELIEFRPGDLDEVLSQMSSFDAYFQGALAYTPSTHPCTNYLVQGGMRAAEFAAMYYKNLFQRPRPWQLWPQLMPPVQVPGHASFPSAHSTQANTVAQVLQAVAAAVVPSVADVTTRMAQRIARGREVLGLHYPSDSAAGVVLANEVATTFLQGAMVSRLVTAAQNEWISYTT
jgi:PAP2 superfamily